ncbi:MAG: Nif3-like dinuclear metal center hexameric protein [Akkermansiaceae bacterium]|nr:Nif3-like dinuclear metal center hexameric protein [Akkermansiaceae bacterium]NNM31044.1 Nif3-like dinuclear metal center hexameric protein [Akkermansiaceae bacterium]
MTALADIVSHLDEELRVAEVPDYPGAENGLQLEGGAEVRKVVAAVDASLPVVRKAVDAGADLLVVHHGMFWSGVQPVTGAFHEKLKTAMDAGMAIYSAHLPLDIHPTLGNNALLAAALGIGEAAPFFDFKGIRLGLRGRRSGSLRALVDRAGEVLGGPVHHCPGGGDDAGVVGVITGGAGSEVAAVAREGIDTFVTGEGPHWSFPAAEELGINVIYGGHYATETFGVKALAAHLAETFGLEHGFVDHPTGL